MGFECSCAVYLFIELLLYELLPFYFSLILHVGRYIDFFIMYIGKLCYL